jgi:cytoskeletal protein RodZ
MTGFGEELRMERAARGISLDDIIAVTKISRRHLQALEEERFDQLPGGILNKGIVRAYVSVLGLDPEEWVARYSRAYAASGRLDEDERNWVDFAANVGRARAERHELLALRLRWILTILLLLITAALLFLSVRYYGLRAGWWSQLLPAQLNMPR